LGGLCCVLLVSQALAGPRRCGDDVAGKAIPCDCGDLLVSSRTLGADDPVTQRTCDGTGLLVDVAPGAPPATLGLGGHTLAGTGRGAGIRVLSGGDGGLTILGPGRVEGFGTGVLAPGGELARLDGVTSADNHGDGFGISGDNFVIRNAEATRNGRDGFSLRGTGYVVDGNRAVENARHGFTLAGRTGSIGAALANEASGNGGQGFKLRGRDHSLDDAVALGNARDGIRARVTRGRIRNTYVAGNNGDAVRATGVDLDLAGRADIGEGSIRVRGARSRDCRGARCK
jgi:hypothetical protein